MLALLGDGPFPAYIVQEYLDGPEETVDAICLDGELLLPMTRTREALRAGLAMDFTLLERPREEEYSARLAAALEMDYFLSVQFKGGKLMEINPRVSTIVYTPEINPPALAVGTCARHDRPRRAAPPAVAGADRAARDPLLRPGRIRLSSGRAGEERRIESPRPCPILRHPYPPPSSPTSAG